MEDLKVQASSSFVQPHFIEELGEEGLTAHEIARSLKVDIEAIHRKLRRQKWHSKNSDFYSMPYVIINKNNGIEYHSFVLPTQSAKAFVARWNNEVSDAYLKFLFDCEEIVLEKIPVMASELLAMKEELAKLRKPRLLKTSSRSQYVRIPVMQSNLWGGSEVVWISKPREQAQELELLFAKQRKQQETMNGLIEKMAKTNAEILEWQFKRNQKLICA